MELVRVTVVDMLGKQAMDMLVRPPHRVLDYNTKYAFYLSSSVYVIFTFIYAITRHFLVFTHHYKTFPCVYTPLQDIFLCLGTRVYQQKHCGV